MKTDDKTLIAALDILAHDIQTDDGVANACIAEAAQRLRELTEWHPIETAPKDGTRILILYNDKVEIGWYKDSKLFLESSSDSYGYRSVITGERSIRDINGNLIKSGKYDQLWQPLPAAPKPTEGK